jgi:hypothetical protein
MTQTAFPAPRTTDSTPGMSLRDYFAAAVLQGECAAQSEENGWINSNEAAKFTALKCYGIADAMIAAREVGNEE